MWGVRQEGGERHCRLVVEAGAGVRRVVVEGAAGIVVGGEDGDVKVQVGVR